VVHISWRPVVHMGRLSTTAERVVEEPALSKDECMETRDALARVSPAVVTVVCFDRTGQQTTQGSGVIVGPDGVVVTAWHVVVGAAAARIQLPIGAHCEVEGLLAWDSDADFAALKVEGKGLPSALLGDSDEVRQGDRVLTLGTPLGLDQTASEGIVSAVRDGDRGGRRLQITAPMSPGSSGGPVMNLRGEVIGIAIFSMKEGQNLNFAIPINNMKPKLKSTGKVTALAKAGAVRMVKATRSQLGGSAESLYQQGLAALPKSAKGRRARVQFEQALVLFRKALEEQPDYADAWLEAGSCLNSLGLWEDALEAIKQAILLQPDWAVAHNRLGLVHYGCNAQGVARREEALRAFQEAVRLEPDFADAHFNLGLSYFWLMGYWTKPATKDCYRRAAFHEYEILKNLSADLAGQLFELLEGYTHDLRGSETNHA